MKPLETFATNWRYRQHIHTEPTHWLHIDGPLFLGLLLLAGFGIVILYSAGNQDLSLLTKHVTHFSVAVISMLLLAQISPTTYRRWSTWIFILTFVMLVAVLIIGHIGKGAQRWLDLGLIRFQPSELMKIALPLYLARFLASKPLPPDFRTTILAGLLIVIPALLVAKQPDLGTAILIVAAGGCVLFLAGLSWRLLLWLTIFTAATTPFLWYFLHDYQRQRVLTFLNPERDPLGSGYHIIQSKIAIGSGGLFGKGWLHGTQSHLQFLPAHTTDFIFAVCGEEFGLLGSFFLISLILFITGRCLYLSTRAQDSFTRLTVGSVGLLFFISAFVNIGMVTGILPVVGIPLPLVSYGGTSLIIMMMGFGLVMSFATHRKLVRS